jgi:YggT family protein
MLVYIIQLLFQVYLIMLFARILCSWIPDLQGYRFMQFLRFYTDPYLNLFRRYIPPLGIFDLSPLLAFLALDILKRIFVGLLS